MFLFGRRKEEFAGNARIHFCAESLPAVPVRIVVWVALVGMIVQVSLIIFDVVVVVIIVIATLMLSVVWVALVGMVVEISLIWIPGISRCAHPTNGDISSMMKNLRNVHAGNNSF